MIHHPHPDSLNIPLDIHELVCADRDKLEIVIKILSTALEEIADGCCDINHPPECCDCAMKRANKALKEAGI